MKTTVGEEKEDFKRLVFWDFMYKGQDKTADYAPWFMQTLFRMMEQSTS